MISRQNPPPFLKWRKALSYIHFARWKDILEGGTKRTSGSQTTDWHGPRVLQAGQF
jgi:hypothetical protein